MGYKKPNSKESFEYAMAVLRLCEITHIRHYQIWYRIPFIFNMTSMAKEQKKLLDIIHGLSEKVFNYKTEQFKTKQIDRKINGVEEVEEEKYTKADKEAEIHYAKDDLDNDDDDVGMKKREAFLNGLIEQRNQPATFLSDEDVKEEIDTIMFEVNFKIKM